MHLHLFFPKASAGIMKKSYFYIQAPSPCSHTFFRPSVYSFLWQSHCHPEKLPHPIYRQNFPYRASAYFLPAPFPTPHSVSVFAVYPSPYTSVFISFKISRILLVISSFCSISSFTPELFIFTYSCEFRYDLSSSQILSIIPDEYNN